MEQIIHNLTTSQVKTIVKCIGDNPKHFPKIDYDPVVNYVVDCIILGEREYNEKLYKNEVNAMKNKL